MTSKAYTKYKQISKNPNVALCIDNIQLEGTANVLGHPSLEENKEIVDICLKKQCDDFAVYLKYKNTVLIEVDITRVELWRERRREYADLIKNEAFRIG